MGRYVSVAIGDIVDNRIDLNDKLQGNMEDDWCGLGRDKPRRKYLTDRAIVSMTGRRSMIFLTTTLDFVKFSRRIARQAAESQKTDVIMEVAGGYVALKNERE